MFVVFRRRTDYTGNRGAAELLYQSSNGNRLLTSSNGLDEVKLVMSKATSGIKFEHEITFILNSFLSTTKPLRGSFFVVVEASAAAASAAFLATSICSRPSRISLKKRE